MVLTPKEKWENDPILLKADELFISNVITGIQPITKYRKKEFTSEVAKEITSLLNALIN